MPNLEISVSDTITVTDDGRVVVDTGKLMAKEHIQKMIREMRSKTKNAPTRHSKTQFAQSAGNHAITD